MQRPHFSVQVGIGPEGSQDTGAQHRAIRVAEMLWAIGRWPHWPATRLVVHDPRQVLAHLQLSGPGRADPATGVLVYPGAEQLREGEHYEFHPLPRDFWPMHGLPEPGD